MFCNSCGARNSDSAKFCRNCGASLLEDIPPVSEEVFPEEDYFTEDFTQEDRSVLNVFGNPIRDTELERDLAAAAALAKKGAALGAEVGKKAAAVGAEVGKKAISAGAEYGKKVADKGRGINPKTLLLGIIGLIVLIAFILVLINASNTINLNNYLSFSTDGYNGEGRVYAHINFDAIESRYGDKISFSDRAYQEMGGFINFYTPMEVFEDNVDIDLDSYRDAYNGQEIRYTWDIDEDFYTYLNCKIKFKNGTYKVSGLPDNPQYISYSDSSSQYAETVISDSVYTPEPVYTAEPVYTPEPVYTTQPVITPQPVFTPTPSPAVSYSSALTATVSSYTIPNGGEIRAYSSSASSALKEGSYTHTADDTRDRNLLTAWNEGANGIGTGETLRYQFDSAQSVSDFTMYLGFWKTAKLWEQNARPAQIKITFSEGSEVYVDFPNKMEPFTVTLSRPVSTTSITFTMTKVYKGTLYEDLCIGDIIIGSDSYSAQTSSTITFKDKSLPTSIKAGKAFTIAGLLQADRGIITNIDCKIVNSNGTIVQNCSVRPFTFSYQLKDSVIDNSMLFGKLSTGSYIFTLDVQTANGISNIDTYHYESSFLVT